jgi:succinyl-diaminopimelate desuccinylase
MRNDLLEHLATLVSFESVEDKPDEKKRLLRWVHDTFFSSTTLVVHEGDIDGAPYLYLQHESPDFLWFAHVDVVPGAPEQFSLRIEGDKAYGRGAKDMKGGALPFLLAYKNLIDGGLLPRISILLTSDEETAGPSIPRLLEKGILKAPVAFTPDTGSSPGIVAEHKGVVWAELIAKGTGGHGAMPWESDNPIWKLSEALQILHKHFPSGKESDWQVTVSPTSLQGSNARNQVPHTARCGIDIRYPQSLCGSAEEAMSLVREKIPQDCTLQEVLSASPLKTDPDHPAIKLVKSLAEEVEGRSVDIIREHGGTDARYFGEVGIPAFLYGPVGGDLHGTNEWVSIPSLIDQYEINRKLIKKFS